MVAGLKALAMLGGATTVTEALAVPPAPPLVELTAPVMLFWVPACVPVTLMLNWHWELAAMVAPVRLMLPVPVVAVMVPPPQEPVKPLGVVTVKPAGSVSVNPTPVSELPAFGLVIVNVKLVDPPVGMVAAPNAFAIDGGPSTVKVALAVFPVPPFVELTAPVVLL
jgi:hypothetical protein